MLRFDSDEFRNVYFSIEGEEQSVLNFLDSLDERLSAMRPWYGTAVEGLFREMVVVLFISLLLYTVLSKAMAKLITSMPFAPQTLTTYKQVIVASIPFALLGIAVPIAMLKLRAYVFPNGVFAIGQGAYRHQSREAIRTLVVVGFLINLAAGVILWFITTN